LTIESPQLQPAEPLMEASEGRAGTPDAARRNHA
jgi:hypothetical protein